MNADGTQTLSSETVYDSKINILSQTDGNSNTQTYTYYDDGTQHTYVSGNIKMSDIEDIEKKYDKDNEE